MIIAFLKGLIMADAAPTPEELVPSLLHAFMWASAFGAVEELRVGRLWTSGGLFVAALTFHIVGIYWPQIKPKISPRFALAVEWIASRRIYRQIIYSVSAVVFLASIGTAVYRHYVPVRVPQPTTQSTPSPIPISFRLGCEIDHIPIHILAASTIHVLRLHPAILYGNPRIQDLGVFENISSPSDKPMDWPTKTSGRWMTKKEMTESWSSG